MTTELTTQEPKRELTEVETTYSGQTFSPRIDIWETDNELVLYADVPGVAPEDLDIQFENRELRIHGRVRPRHENLEFVYGEYAIGDFYRTFSIGESIDASRISAELQHGVLVLTLPKVEEVKPRRIEVKTQ